MERLGYKLSTQSGYLKNCWRNAFHEYFHRIRRNNIVTKLGDAQRNEAMS